MEVIDFPGFPTVVVKQRDLDTSQMGSFMDSAFTALKAAIDRGVFEAVGPAFTRYDTPFGATVTLEAGFPVETPLAEAVEVGDVRVEPSELPACDLATARHQGSYEGLGGAWMSLMQEIEAAGYAAQMPYWEAYDVEPTPEMDPADLLTGLAVPVERKA